MPSCSDFEEVKIPIDIKNQDSYAPTNSSAVQASDADLQHSRDGTMS